MDKKNKDLSNPASIDDVKQYIEDDRIMIKKCEDKMRVINYAVSRYGYETLPIFCVRYKYKEPGYPEYGYHVFVGEVPYKDKNGEWTTTHKVPSFTLMNLKGARFIDNEPDIPHILRVQTDEIDHKEYIKSENLNYEKNQKIRELEDAVKYCTLPTYFKGVLNRLERFFWHIAFLKKSTSNEVDTHCPAR